MQSLAQGIDGRGADLNAAFGNLAPFAEDTNTLLVQLDRQEQALQQLIRNTGTVFNALSARSDELTGLIRNSNTVFGTIADRNAAAAGDVPRVPDVRARVDPRRSSASTASRATANPIITAAAPGRARAEPDAAGGRQTRAVVPRLLRRPRAAHHGRESRACRRSGASSPTLRPALGQLDPFTRSLNPFLGYIADYLPELDAFVGNIVGGDAGDARSGGGRRRSTTCAPLASFSPEGLSIYPQRLATNRPNPYRFPRSARRS